MPKPRAEPSSGKHKGGKGKHSTGGKSTKKSSGKSSKKGHH
jgi:hypothetical protein